MTAERELTDDEVAQVVRYIVQLALEVERGLRSSEQLRPVMAPTGWKHWQQRSSRPSFPSRPVLPDDIGPPQLTRNERGRAFATVTVRTEPGRWAAISMSLEVKSGRCRVMDLHRLPATGERKVATSAARQREVPLEIQACLLREVRDLAAAARDAATRRLGELPTTVGASDRRDALALLAHRWNDLVDDHDHQLAQLYTTLQTRMVVQRSRHR